MYQQTFITLQWQLKTFHLRFHFFTIKIFTLNVPFGAQMVFSRCSIPSTGRAQCSASIHSQMALIYQLQAISWKSTKSTLSEDDETCLYCRSDVTWGQGVNAAVMTGTPTGNIIQTRILIARTTFMSSHVACN